jgi:hypothetical protein
MELPLIALFSFIFIKNTINIKNKNQEKLIKKFDKNIEKYQLLNDKITSFSSFSFSFFLL